MYWSYTILIRVYAATTALYSETSDYRLSELKVITQQELGALFQARNMIKLTTVLTQLEPLRIKTTTSLQSKDKVTGPNVSVFRMFNHITVSLIIPEFNVASLASTTCTLLGGIAVV